MRDGGPLASRGSPAAGALSGLPLPAPRSPVQQQPGCWAWVTPRRAHGELLRQSSSTVARPPCERGRPPTIFFLYPSTLLDASRVHALPCTLPPFQYFLSTPLFIAWGGRGHRFTITPPISHPLGPCPSTPSTPFSVPHQTSASTATPWPILTAPVHAIPPTPSARMRRGESRTAPPHEFR